MVQWIEKCDKYHLILFLLICKFFISTVWANPLIRIEDTGFFETTAGLAHKGHKGIYRRQVKIFRPEINYQLSDLFCLDNEYHPKPFQIIPGGSVTGFYRMKLCLDGKNGGLPCYSVIEKKDKGVVDIIRDFENAAIVRYRYVALLEDKNLYLEILLNKQKPIDNIKLTFNLYPDFVAPHNRWLATPNRNMIHQEEIIVLSPQEYWFYCYDKEKPVGGSALLYDPTKVKKVDIRTKGNYGFYISIDFLQDTEKIRLCLRFFPKGTEDTRIISEFKEKAPIFLSRLRSDIFQIENTTKESFGKSGKSLTQILAKHRKKTPEENFSQYAKIVRPVAPYPLLKLDKRKTLRLKLERGKITGDYKVLKVKDNNSVVKLGSNGIIDFDIDSIEPCYWQVNLRHGDLAFKNEFPRLQCMLNTQIIGLANKDYIPSGSYTSFKQSVGVEKIGTVFINEGKHKLWLKACYTPVESVDYLELVPLNKKVQKPILTFVQITDAHISGKGAKKIYIQTLKDINKTIQPDFIMDTGDYCCGGWCNENDQKEYRKLAENIAAAPYYFVQGNHDLGNNPDLWCSIFERENICYSFNHKGFHFVVLGVEWPVLWAGNLKEKDFTWLDEDLNSHQNKKTFIFLHPNLVPYAADPNILPRGGTGTTCNNALKVLNILDKHPNVVAVFAGHLHKNYLSVRKGVLHVVTSSLCANYPLSYKEVRVFSDRFEMISHQVSDEAFLLQSFIKGGFMGISLEKSELQEAVKNNIRGVIRNSGQVGLNHELNGEFMFK